MKAVSGLMDCEECGAPTPTAGVTLCAVCAREFEAQVGDVLAPLDAARLHWSVDCGPRGQVESLTVRSPTGEPLRLPRSALERIAQLLAL